MNDIPRNRYAPGSAALEMPAVAAARPGVVRVALWLIGVSHVALTVLWPSMINTSESAVTTGKDAAEAHADYSMVALGFVVLAAFLFGPFGLLVGAAKRRGWARTTLVVTLPLVLAFIALMVAVSGTRNRAWLWPALLALMGLEVVGLVLLCTTRANRWYRERANAEQ
jgi:hypothetical protein